MSKLIVAIAGAVLCTALVTGAALAALSSGASHSDSASGLRGAQHEVVTTTTFPSAAMSVLDVDSGWGSIEVVAWDRDEVELVETRSLSSGVGFLGVPTGTWVSKAQARKSLESVRVDIIPDDRALRVRVNAESPDANSQVTLKLSFRVPRQTAVRLVSTDGAIAASALEGGVEVSTVNGKIDLNRIQGSVHAATDNGRVQLTEVNGDVRVVTENGAIACREIAGVADLRSTNGSIRTLGAGGNALVCRSANGSIEIELAQDGGCGLDILSAQGNVECGLPLDALSERGHHAIRGTVRGGGPVLSLVTTNGRIRVNEG